MKKLALALVCLVSVAFLASCDPEITNPQPTIAVMTGENFVYDGQVLDVNTDYSLGFNAASNSQTLKELKTFTLSIKILDNDGEEMDSNVNTIDVSGTEYQYLDEEFGFVLRSEIIGKAEITATITDVDGQLATTTLVVSINMPAEPLTITDFTWNRHGAADATGLAEFGLKWTKNERAIYAVIEPLAGATLYKFEPSVWNQVTTTVEKAAAFEGMVSISQWKEFNTAGAVNQDLDVVLGSIYNGEMYLMHVTHGHIESFKGTDVTLTGQAK